MDAFKASAFEPAYDRINQLMALLNGSARANTCWMGAWPLPGLKSCACGLHRNALAPECGAVTASSQLAHLLMMRGPMPPLHDLIASP